MGLGKTRITLETARGLHAAGEINGLIVVAPRGVHRAWVVDQAEHLPDDHGILGLDWWSSRAATREQQTRETEVLSHPGLSLLSIPYSGVMTDRGKTLLKKFLTTRRCLYVLDESHNIKTPKAARTKRLIGSGRYAPYRRILTGTFLADKPFDAYTQLRFLEPDAWAPLGISGSEVFRSYFGVIEKKLRTDKTGKLKDYPVVVGHKNLDVLRRVILEHGSHLLKTDVLNLPPKTYVKRYFELTPEQRSVYERVRKEVRVELDAGDLTLPLQIVRLTRLQQAACGYLPTDDDEELRLICKQNPRLEALFDIVEEANGQRTIVWAKFTKDIDLIMAEAAKRGISAVRFTGKSSDDEVRESVDRFKSGRAQLFVSDPSVGGAGLNLMCAKLMVYYSCSYKLMHRRQSEDRFWRIGQEDPVTIIDLIGMGTIDNGVIDRLRTKREVVSEAMGEKIGSWI